MADIPENITDMTLPQVEAYLGDHYDIPTMRAVAEADDRQGTQKMVRAALGDLILMSVDPGEDVTDAKIMTPDEAVLAGLTGKLETTEESIFANDLNAEAKEDGNTGAVVDGKVEHTRQKLVRLYKPDQQGIFGPVNIPEGNVGHMIREGLKAICPHCNRQNCRAGLLDRNLPAETWYDCPGIPTRNFMRCGVCRKKYYDPLDPRGEHPDEDLEEGEIPSEAYTNATPKARIDARLDRHYIGFHPEEARVRGIRPLERDPLTNEQNRTVS